MELEQIRQISLVGFLEGMGHVPVSRKGNDVWFRSPFRNERTASFKVDTQRNVWFDFGIGKGGDIFHLAGELTGSTGFMEQLEFLSGKSGILPLRPLQERKKIPRVSGFEDVKVTELSHEALKGYLKERGIDPAIAGRFCKEVAYGIRGKRYFAIGFMNRSGGYELRNPMFKGCISPKDISCVSLSGKKQDTCCVFEGFIDFLSALVLRTVEDEDCLVLNSVSNLERSYAVLEVSAFLCFLLLATLCKPTTCKILFRETNPGRDKNGTKPQENKIKNASSPTSLVVDFSFLCKGTILSRELQTKSCKYAAYQTFILHGHFREDTASASCTDLCCLFQRPVKIRFMPFVHYGISADAHCIGQMYNQSAIIRNAECVFYQ